MKKLKLIFFKDVDSFHYFYFNYIKFRYERKNKNYSVDRLYLSHYSTFPQWKYVSIIAYFLLDNLVAKFFTYGFKKVPRNRIKLQVIDIFFCRNILNLNIDFINNFDFLNTIFYKMTSFQNRENANDLNLQVFFNYWYFVVLTLHLNHY